MSSTKSSNPVAEALFALEEADDPLEDAVSRIHSAIDALNKVSIKDLESSALYLSGQLINHNKVYDQTRGLNLNISNISFRRCKHVIPRGLYV